MKNFTISVFGNKILSEILKEIKLFSKFKIKFYDDLNLCINDAESNGHLLVYFTTTVNKDDYKKLKKNNFPLIEIAKSKTLKNFSTENLVENLILPFRILDLEKKIISLLAKYEFKKSSLINLSGYIIDKNKRKIKKNDLDLQLTEKEINFLILFSQNQKPLSRNFILKNVWHYSSRSDTHTVETHIHRLRKKILEKFNDSNFIKNNDEGYYI